MRNEELLNKAKEQQCEVKGVVDQFSEWEEMAKVLKDIYEKYSDKN